MRQQTSLGQKIYVPGACRLVDVNQPDKKSSELPRGVAARDLRPETLLPAPCSCRSRGGSCCCCCLSEVNRLPSVNVVPPSSKAQLERRRVDNGIGCACNPNPNPNPIPKPNPSLKDFDKVASARYNLHLMRKLAANWIGKRS